MPPARESRTLGSLDGQRPPGRVLRPARLRQLGPHRRPRTVGRCALAGGVVSRAARDRAAAPPPPWPLVGRDAGDEARPGQGRWPSEPRPHRGRRERAHGLREPPTFLREIAAGRAGGGWIRRHETAGTFDDLEYGEAMDLFYRRYAYRLDPWPDWLNRALSNMDVGANTAMWGPPGAPGPLAALDLRPRPCGIGVPALVVAGRHETAGPRARNGRFRRASRARSSRSSRFPPTTRSPKNANASSPRWTASSAARSARPIRRPSLVATVSAVAGLIPTPCYGVGP